MNPKPTPAKVTERHRELSRDVAFAYVASEEIKGSQLIADSEAQAVAEATASRDALIEKLCDVIEAGNNLYQNARVAVVHCRENKHALQNLGGAAALFDAQRQAVHNFALTQKTASADKKT